MKNKLTIGIIAVAVVIGGIVFLLRSEIGNKVLVETFSTDVTGLPEAKPTEMVELKNGDTYDLAASYVKKTIAGKEQVMLAYNGSIPGQTIRVAQGAEVTVNFTNNTDIPALLHSHGVRMDNAFDGSQLQQKEMKPGESFSYKLKFPDAGVYWYHPHTKEVYGQGLGLYGAFIVSPTDASYFPPVNQEVPVFLSDLPVENGVVTLDKNKTSHSLMGHYGNVMLTNGEEQYELKAKSGEVVRLYVVNAANSRPYNFTLDGLKMKLVGADSGAYERASFVDSVVLGPSERAIVDVFMPHAGRYEIRNVTPDKIYFMGNIMVSDENVDVSYKNEFNTLQRSREAVASIDPFRKLFNAEPTKQIALTLDMGGNQMSMMGGNMMMKASSGGIEWDDTNQNMNAMSNTDSIKWKIVDPDTKKENMDIDWTFKRGEPVKIRIFNDPKSMHPMQHPIHFHGQRFLVVARNGVSQANLVWKDTVLVKSGETVDIVLDPTNPGTWMAHCHISEHLEAGMMFKFSVE